MATIKGTNRDDTLYGTASDDTIDAYDGNNVVYGGNGNNRITAGSGNDAITAGTGNDTIDAGNGNNVIDAGDGRNTVASGSGNDVVTTGAGDDTIDAGDGDNRVTAGAGTNRITTGRGADMIYAGSGNDTIKAGDGNNIVDAGAGTNWISAGTGNDRIVAGSGNDTILAGDGTNSVTAGDGNNCITAGSGSDTITAGSGNDTVDAGDGTNIVDAGSGTNTVVTGSGNDTITAGSGNDCIDAGRGDNVVNAGDGNNDVTAGSGADRINSGSGNDVIRAGDGLNVIDAGNGNNLVTAGDDADRVRTGIGNDLIYTGGGNDVVDAGAGSDVVLLDGGDDTVRHDVAANKDSCDIYWGGSGTDTLQLVLTAAQTADPAIQADIARFNATGGGGALGIFCFNSINLTTWSFEKVVVVAPADAIDDVTTVGEDATVVINVLGNDKDLGAANNAALRVTGFDASGLPGTLTLNPNGTFTYVPGSAYQSLAAGQNAATSFTYTITDDQGYSDTATVRITVTGANDAPVFAVTPAGGQVVEGGAVAASGGIAFTDVDAIDTHGVSFTPRAAGYLGTFTATKASDSTGGTTGQVGWTFTVAPSAIAFLNAGETLTQTYQVKVDDGKGGTATKDVVVTIVGTNGSPVASGDVATTSENAVLTIAVLGNDTDPDGDTLTVTGVSAPIGKGSATTNGTTVAFDPGTAFDHLAVGQSEIVTLSYAISDGHGGTANSTVRVTVTGTNDAPVVSAAIAGAATEDGATVALDALAGASDLDDGTILAVVVPATLPAGVSYDVATHSFALNPANAAYQSLVQGQTTVVTVSYGITDGVATTPASVQWTLTGVNDAPVVTGAVVGAATEDGASVALNALANASDADAGATLSVVVPATLPAGVTYDAATHAFALDPANAAYQSLAVGQTKVVSISYGVTDGTVTTSASVQWTVAGTNDDPVVSGPAIANAAEDGAPLTIDLLANTSDVDQGATLSIYGFPILILPPGVTYDATAHTMTLNPADPYYQSLAVGESETFEYPFYVTDGISPIGTKAVFTVTGTNDAPVVTGAVIGTAIEDGASVTLDALGNASDVDHNAALAVTLGGALPAGVTYDAAAHSFTLDPSNAAFQSLAEGQSMSVSYDYAVSDGIAPPTPARVSWTVTGTNDDPVVSGPAIADAAEDGASVTIDLLANTSDVDQGATLSIYGFPILILPPGVTYDATAHTMTLNPADPYYQSLAVGESETFEYPFYVTDGISPIGTKAVFTVTGTNDAPVATADVYQVAEDGGIIARVNQNDSDIDHGAMLRYALTGAPIAGLDMSQGGGLSFTPGATYDSLAQGETAEVVATYSVADEFGASAQSTATITIVGENDAPVVSGAVSDAATEDGAPVTLDALATASDVDHGTTLSVVLGGVLPAGVTFDPATHSFTLDPSSAAYQSLARGQTRAVTYSYGVSDGIAAATPATVSWLVTGTNDAPVAVADTGATTENQAITLDVLANDTDVDDGHAVTLTSVTTPVGKGSASIVGNTLVFTPGADFDHLQAGATEAVVIAYAATDDQGATAQSTATITVTGTTDGPVVAGTVGGIATEDGAAVSLNALGRASDVDDGTILSVVNIAPLPAGVTYDATSQKFTLDPSSAAYQALAAGETTTVTVDYAVSDGIAPPVAASASWTVTGVNDAPVANPVDGRVAGGSARINLMLVLDLSGSMDAGVGTTGETRLTLAKTALNNLISLYDAKGEVAVRLVTFGDQSVDVAGRWLTAVEARAEIAGYVANGNTNYDYGVIRAREAFQSGDGRLAGGQNLSYFLSDGEPNEGTNLPNTSAVNTGAAFVGLNAYEEAQWTSFLSANAINSFAIGIGTGLSTAGVNQYLGPVAYNGATGANTGAQLVTDVKNLGAVLAATANAPVTGNLLTSASPAGSFGPDDPGYVRNIVIGSSSFALNYAANTVGLSGSPRAFTYDQATHVLTTTDQTGGALSINLLTGNYSFTVPNNAALGALSTVGFTLADLAGATASSTLSLSNNGVQNDRVITNATSGTITITDDALLANDLDQSGAAIAIAAVAQGTGGVATRVGSGITFVIDPAFAVGTFGYTGTSSTGSDTATVTVDHSQAGASRLLGTAGADIIIVRAGAAITVEGGAGDDRIFGSSSTETYRIGTAAGFDVIRDTSLGNVLSIAGTGDLGTFEVRTLQGQGTAASPADLLFSVGDSVVQVVGGNASGFVSQVAFDGAKVYGATLATQYGIAGFATGSYGSIFRPTPNPANVNGTTTTVGSGFDDIIYGGGGSDLINAAAGNDILIGGDGADRLTGGTGSDTFVFLSATDGNGTSDLSAGSLYDTIVDFQQGLDRISLMAIDANATLAGDQAFAFVGTATTTTQAYSITWEKIDVNSVMLHADVDGDGIADLSIRVDSSAAIYTPLATDFYL